MLMEGNSMTLETEHGKAVAAFLSRRQETLGEAIEASNFALSAAEIPRGIRRTARATCEDYFYTRLKLTPDYELKRLEAITGSLEPLQEPMYKVLEDIVELVVDGEYEDLRALSQNRLDVEDMRRRVEDDCPEALVLPPREIYRVEAITKSDEPEEEGWTFFLELWAEDGPATLHLEGHLRESGPSFEATLFDILP
jgi:hypothetical protein